MTRLVASLLFAVLAAAACGSPEDDAPDAAVGPDPVGVWVLDVERFSRDLAEAMPVPEPRLPPADERTGPSAVPPAADPRARLGDLSMEIEVRADGTARMSIRGFPVVAMEDTEGTWAREPGGLSITSQPDPVAAARGVPVRTARLRWRRDRLEMRLVEGGPAMFLERRR